MTTEPKIRMHDLKCHKWTYVALAEGVRTYGIRRNDRGFRVGDFLRLRCWEPKTGYIGEPLYAEIKYINDYAHQPGMVVMGIARVDQSLALRIDFEVVAPPDKQEDSPC